MFLERQKSAIVSVPKLSEGAVLETTTDAAEMPCLFAPVDGEVCPLSESSDTVFAQGMLGPGFIVKPIGGLIHSPVAGTVKLIHSTAHGYGFDTDKGHEVIVHLGVDTVELGSEPFDARVHVGDHVEAGQVIASMRNSLIKAAGRSDEVVVLIDDISADQFQLDYTGAVKAGQKVGHLL